MSPWSRSIAIFLAMTAMGTVLCGNPTQEFFQRVQQGGSLTTYQCYRNGSSFEPADARSLKVVWMGNSYRRDKAIGVVTFTEPNQPEATAQVNAQYTYGADYIILSANGKSANLYIPLPPENGEAYLFREVNPADGSTVFKMYDTDETCENAKALHDSICEMNYVR